MSRIGFSSVPPRLVLGTAQMAGGYGLGQHPPPSVDAVRELLRAARECGVTEIDTAIEYGAAEVLLGIAGVSDLQVATKIRLPRSLASRTEVKSWVVDSVTGALSRLGVAQLRSVLVHRVEDLAGPLGGDLVESLEGIVASGLAARAGLSCYEPGDLRYAEIFDGTVTLQIPLNVLDRRFESCLESAECGAKQREYQIRSVFLQGVLSSSRADAQRWFGNLHPDLDRWFAWCERTGVLPGVAALSAVLMTPGVDSLVVGVETPSQLRELSAWANLAPVQVPDLQSLDPDLIDPRRWVRWQP